MHGIDNYFRKELSGNCALTSKVGQNLQECEALLLELLMKQQHEQGTSPPAGGSSKYRVTNICACALSVYLFWKHGTIETFATSADDAAAALRDCSVNGEQLT